MKLSIVLTLAAASLALAQPPPRQLTVATGVGGAFMQIPDAVVQGAPYSATIVNESTQTLSDGNRIVQSATGSTARDSQGRTRQDMALPSIGNLSAANAPHLVFIQDPVAKTAYSLNLTDKTAHKMPMPPPGLPGAIQGQVMAGAFSAAILPRSIAVAEAGVAGAGVAGPGPVVMKAQLNAEQADIHTEDLGATTMQGVAVHGVRTTRTIAAGQIGNDRPIEIVTEVWTSPELQTIVYSKRSDPRTGEQVFQLTNIVRSEPDPSQFTVPSDFKLAEGPEGKRDVIFYRPNE